MRDSGWEKQQHCREERLVSVQFVVPVLEQLVGVPFSNLRESYCWVCFFFFVNFPGKGVKSKCQRYKIINFSCYDTDGKIHKNESDQLLPLGELHGLRRGSLSFIGQGINSGGRADSVAVSPKGKVPVLTHRLRRSTRANRC